MKENGAPSLRLAQARLPWYQQVVMRTYIGPFVAAAADPADSRVNFESANQRILELIDDLPPQHYSTPVLVPPQAALEDDSRYWSVAMTLEHLIMVGDTVKIFVTALARGESPQIYLEMAAVKPRNKVSPAQSLADFRLFAATCMDELEPLIKNANTTATHPHPWFGAFNSHQWYWLLAAHSNIHLKQIKGILKGLPYEADQS